MHLVSDIYVLKENIYSQLYYTKVLNECSLQHTSNAHKVRVIELNTCIIVYDYLGFYSSKKTMNYCKINKHILKIYVPCLYSLIAVKRNLT